MGRYALIILASFSMGSFLLGAGCGAESSSSSTTSSVDAGMSAVDMPVDAKADLALMDAGSSADAASSADADMLTTQDMTSEEEETYPPAPEQDEIRLLRANRLATNAYIYGLPAVLMDVTRQGFVDAGVPMNVMVHLEEIPTAGFTAVVRPNTDTLYSSAWLDLEHEPVVLEVPAIAPSERFYMFALLDIWTNAFASPGSRTNLGAEKKYMIVGPDYAGGDVAGLETITAPTNVVWIIGRTEVRGQEDVPNVIAIQQDYKLSTLSQFQSGDYPEIDLPDYSALSGDVGPAEFVEQMSPEDYYSRLIQIMRDNAPPEQDSDMLDDLAELGVNHEFQFDFQSLSDNRKSALESSSDYARTVLDMALSLNNRNGSWGPPASIPLGDYGTSYTIRAAVAEIGLGANLNVDARYVNTSVDSSGEELEGSNSYTIHFDADEIPPVNAFWSMTLYGSDGYLVDNPSNKYTVGSNTDLYYNADGSLDIFVQPTPPMTVANWLPTPTTGAFELTMRMYWPEEPVLTGEWEAPPVTRVP